MAEGNIYSILSGRSMLLIELLITICVRIACVSTLQVILTGLDKVNLELVAYEDVLKSRVQEIQSHIEQIHYYSFFSLYSDHYPVHIGSFTEVIVFVWASDRKTHAIRKCIYGEMKRRGNNFIRYRPTDKSNSKFLSVTFCNMSAVLSVHFKKVNEAQVIGLSLFDPAENDGMVIESTITSFYELPTVRSWINVRPLTIAGSHTRTLVCSSLQLTSNKTGKLRQKFFSIVGSSSEVIVKSSETGDANVTLDFDVLALHTSRLGLLNDSNTELRSLSDLRVYCNKLDGYGLSNDSNEIIDTNVTDELIMTTKSLLINDKLRIRVNVSVPVVSDHSFGKYRCVTFCLLQTKHSNKTLYGCIQVKNFSIVPNNWRDKSLFYRLENKNCEKRIDHITEECQTIIAGGMLLILVLMVILLIIFAVLIIKKIVQHVREQIHLKIFTSLQSVLQSTENSDNRNMKYDVFLSYSSKDRPWVESTLLKFLESKGFKVCFDQRDFPYGCNLVEAIPRAVYESHKVIAVISSNYLSSRWCVLCEFVATYTKILDKEAAFSSLLLIKYKNCQMPEGMNCLKYLDYTTVTTECDDNRNVLAKILSRLWVYKQPDVVETTREAQFFDALLSWLGEPQVGAQL